MTAHALLMQETEANPSNELAWLWLAYVADHSSDRLFYLRRVLEINPKQEQARTGLKKVLLIEGVARAKEGDKGQARSLLLEASELDPTNELIWLWLAAVAESKEDTIQYLERTLEINPNNERALAWLAKVRPPAASPAATWECPLCLASAPAQIDRCPQCMAVLSLQDLAAVTNNESVNQELLQEAIERLESSGEEADFQVHLNLGLAYLNARQMAAAIARLRTASQLQPGDELLRSQLDMLVEQQNQALAAAAPEKPEKSEPVMPRTVLVVDDSPTVRKIVAITLERQGYRVLTAPGGMEGLAKLNEAIPDLILLDINMPQMDGYQLCKLIKSNGVTKHVPVVMLSGKGGFFNKVRGRMAGATEYLTKPFEPAALLQVVDKHCRRNS